MSELFDQFLSPSRRAQYRQRIIEYRGAVIDIKGEISTEVFSALEATHADHLTLKTFDRAFIEASPNMPKLSNAFAATTARNMEISLRQLLVCVHRSNKPISRLLSQWKPQDSAIQTDIDKAAEISTYGAIAAAVTQYRLERRLPFPNMANYGIPPESSPN